MEGKRANALKTQIKKLKLHFEQEIKTCNDEAKIGLYKASRKTLKEMELKLEASLSSEEESRVWQRNAYMFLV